MSFFQNKDLQCCSKDNWYQSERKKNFCRRPDFFLSESFRIFSCPWYFKNSQVCVCVRAHVRLCACVCQEMEEEEETERWQRKRVGGRRRELKTQEEGEGLIELAKQLWNSQLETWVLPSSWGNRSSCLLTCQLLLLCFLFLPRMSTIWLLNLPKWLLVPTCSYMFSPATCAPSSL